MAASNRRVAVVAVGGIIGLVLGLGLGHWQQQRTLSLVESRHAAERRAVAEAMQQLAMRLDALHDELARDRQANGSERQRVAVRLHELSLAVDDLRVMTQPVVAQLPDSVIESAAPAGIQ